MAKQNLVRYNVIAGTFVDELNAIKYAEMITAKGFKSTVVSTDNDPTANVTAAIMLAAEELRNIGILISSQTDKISELTEQIALLRRAGQPDLKEDKTDKEPVSRKKRTAPSTGLPALLLEKRKQAHLSQAELGSKVGLSNRSICNYEKGINVPLSTLIKLCGVLNISNDELAPYMQSYKNRARR